MTESIERENWIIGCALLMTAVEQTREGSSRRPGDQEALLRNECKALAAFADDSAARLLAGSRKIVARVTDYKFEGSSKRYVISFRAANSEKETETIRTMRTDSPGGGYLIDYVPQLVGKRCVIFKANQPMEGPRSNGRTVRVAPFIVPIVSMP